MADTLHNPTVKGVEDLTLADTAPRVLMSAGDPAPTTAYQEVRSTSCYQAGYREATTWAELVTLQTAGTPTLVCSQLTVTSAETLDGAPIQFTPTGSLDLNGFVVTFDTQVLNPDNHQVFTNFVWADSYPDRYTSRGSVQGTFGNTRVRIPEWWGAQAHATLQGATEGAANVNAINAALLSGTNDISGYNGTEVRLGPGVYTTNAPIRMDSIRSHLIGSKYSRIYGVAGGFDESYFITTEDFPSGVVPMICYGWQIAAPDSDAGFSGRIADLFITCASGTTLSIGGIVWENGLQERSSIEYVIVQGYDFGIGCPRYQRATHNGVAGGIAPPETNTADFKQLWFTSPRGVDAVALSISGYTFSISDVTIDDGASAKEGPSIILYTNETCSLSNVHIEDGLIGSVDGSSILIPNINTGGVYNISGIKRQLKGSNYPLVGITHSTVEIANAKASININGIKSVQQDGVGIYLGTTVTVNDLWTAKTGGTQEQAGPGYPIHTAMYSRQRNDATWVVVTTDPGLIYP